MNLSKRMKIIRHSNAVAAGTTTITPSSGIDTQGFRGCMFEVSFGAIVAGGVQSIEVHQSSDDGSSDAYTAIAGTKVTVADTDDNKIVYVDIYAPLERHLKCVVNRATQNSTIDGIVARLYDPQIVPTTHDSATVLGGELHVAAAEGAA